MRLGVSFRLRVGGAGVESARVLRRRAAMRVKRRETIAMISRITATLTLVLVSACGAAHMALPADVAQASEEVPITDRSSWSGALADESFGLGPYKVTDVDRKWDSTRS